jgi:hypothetical protein
VTQANRVPAAVALAAASLLLLVASLAGGRAGEWLFALVAAVFPVALIAFATSRKRAPWPLLALLAALLVGSSAAILALPGAAWWMFVGLGVAPLLLVSVAFAATFDR